MARLIPEVEAEPFVDGVGVVQYLLKAGLPGSVNVYTKIPDGLRSLVPAVVIRRAGGASTQPRFHSRFLLSVRVWDTTDQAAFSLANAANGVIFNAWKNQTVTPLGHIADWRESSGAQEAPDIGLPEFGCYVSVLDLLVRTPQPS